MLPEDRKLAGLALHSGVPHVRSAHWSYEINLHILLQNGKHGIFLRIWRWNLWVAPLLFRTLGFVFRIQLKVVAGMREMCCESLQIR
jgi:hypothetical protein